MSGRMRKRELGVSKQKVSSVGVRTNLLKGFHAPQKDNSKRVKRRFRKGYQQ